MRLAKSQAGVTGWLARRECGCVRRPGGTPPPPYEGVPPRLRVPIESIAEPRLLKVILLGFSRDGDHLLCYSAAGPRFTLHIFRFRGRAAAAPLLSVPLFAELREHAPQPPRGELGALFGAFSKPRASRRAPRDAPAAQTRTTAWRRCASRCARRRTALSWVRSSRRGHSPRAAALTQAPARGAVVHGCECRHADGDCVAEAEDSPLWRETHAPPVPAGAEEADAAPLRNFVTVVPAPWHLPAAAAPLHATHFRRVRCAHESRRVFASTEPGGMR
jgi:hypothetical protein